MCSLTGPKEYITALQVSIPEKKMPVNGCYIGCLKKFAIIWGTENCCFAVQVCFSRVSDKTSNKCSKDIFIQIYN